MMILVVALVFKYKALPMIFFDAHLLFQGGSILTGHTLSKVLLAYGRPAAASTKPIRLCQRAWGMVPPLMELEP